MKKEVLMLFVFLFSAFFAFSQSSEKISELINAEKLTKGQAAYLAASYMDLMQDDADENEAFEVLKELKLFKANEKPEEAIRLNQVSQIYMKACGLRGGIMYSITKSRRYAFNELKAKGLLPALVTSSMYISGMDGVNLLNDCITRAGGDE